MGDRRDASCGAQTGKKRTPGNFFFKILVAVPVKRRFAYSRGLFMGAGQKFEN
jgi:hypothetical protein